MQNLKTSLVSMIITLIFFAFIYYSYIAVENTRIVHSGQDTPVLQAQALDEYIVVEIAGNEFLFTLDQANEILREAKKYELLIPSVFKLAVNTARSVVQTAQTGALYFEQ
ncbi:MAG: hypothetical protein FWH14_05615 [Oscillospiraceae bacterium]|nr:hypothetical protein [Oscillospiraceae bacterium]